MKRKGILLKGTKTTVAEADQRILENYLTNYEIHEFPKDEAAYSLTDEEGFDIEVELFGQQYRLEVYPNELRTDDFQRAINGKPVEGKDPCQTFKGKVKGTDRAVRLSINENGISGFIQLEGQKLFITKSIKFKLPGGRPTLFVAYYEKDVDDKSDIHCGVTSEEERHYLETLPKPSDIEQRHSHCRFLKIATEADFAFFQLYGGSTNAEILDIINLIEGVYIDTFDVSMRVTFQNVWTTNDPYTGDPLTDAGASLLLSQFTNYWQTNFTGVVRDVAHLFTGVNPYIDGVAGVAYVGTICNNPSLAYGLTRERLLQFTTTAHEIGHNFGGVHGDAVLCGTPNASVMCQGIKQIPMYFSPASITRIGNFINANSGCLNPNLYFRILGNPSFCSSSVYTVSNLRPTETASAWSVTPTAAATISGSGNSRTVTRSGAFNGPFTLSVEITTDCGATNIDRLLYAGAIAGHFIDGPTNVHVNAQEIYWPENPTPTDFTAWNWAFLDMPPGGATITPVFPWYAEIEFHSPAANGDYILTLTLTNECGISQAAPLLIHVDGFSSAKWSFDLDRSRSGEKVVVSLKPNDNGEVLAVDKADIPAFKATVYNRENHRLLDGESENGELVFETRGLPNGVYIIHIQQDGSDVVKRAFHIDR